MHQDGPGSLRPFNMYASLRRHDIFLGTLRQLRLIRGVTRFSVATGAFKRALDPVNHIGAHNLRPGIRGITLHQFQSLLSATAAFDFRGCDLLHANFFDQCFATKLLDVHKNVCFVWHIFPF